MVCLLCSKLAGHKQNEVLLSCYLYYYSLVFERLSWRLEVPREKPFCASSCFSIIICSFALCVPCNSLHCLNEAIFSTLFFFSPLLWTIRIFWRKLECENHLTPSNLWGLRVYISSSTCRPYLQLQSTATAEQKIQIKKSRFFNPTQAGNPSFYQHWCINSKTSKGKIPLKPFLIEILMLFWAF